MGLSSDDVNDLISFGRDIESKDIGSFNLFIERDYLNRQTFDTWTKVVSGLSDEDLIYVYKALLNLERELSWIGGSGASAIWVYMIIKDKGLDKDNQLAEYGFKNSTNPYIPFSTLYCGDRSVKDFFSYQENARRVRDIRLAKYDKVLARLTGQGKKRIAAIAELRKLTYKERGQIRKELLDKHKMSSHIERLSLMVNNDIYPPEYYPIEWIKLSPEEIKELPIELIKKLHDKLWTKTKGEWRRFVKKLVKLDQF